MNVIPIDNKTAIRSVKGGFPYNYDINIYRGCEHGCKYCYAIYSHKYLEDDDYFGNVYYKKNILDCLEKELSNPNWKHQVINLGSVCDSYQPVEKELKIMPEVLRLMIKYKNPIIISTKSDLILRDLDLLKELSELVPVNIAYTITSMDKDVQELIEPGASSSIDRFKALHELKQKTNCTVGVHIMPIIPYITDNYQNLDKIYELAHRVDVDYVLPGTLYLRGKTKPYFLNTIKDFDFNLYQKINLLYQKGSASKEYKAALYKMIRDIKQKHKISGDYMKFQKKS